MLIGITYDLRTAYLDAGYSEMETAEFDRDDTIDAIENALIALGHSAVRIGNVHQLMSRVAEGERWDLVFNICEGLSGVSRESQVPAILESLSIPYTFSDAAVMAVSLNKAWTKAVLKSVVPAADYMVVNDHSDIDTIDLPYPLFAKPLAEGTGKGISANSVVRHVSELEATCHELLETYKQPVLVETFLPGREFTVSLLGTGAKARVLGTFEIILLDSAEADAYGYLNKEECEERVENRNVDSSSDETVKLAEQYALRAWRHLGCRDAGRVDLRCDSFGEPCFIEVNPLAGLNPVHSDLPMQATATGMPYVDLIRLIVESAAERVEQREHDSARRVA